MSPSSLRPVNSDGVRSRQKVNSSILAPPKFTLSSTASTTHLWSTPGSKANAQSNESLQFWWNKNEISMPNLNKTGNGNGGAYCQPDEDTVSLLSGYSTTTSKRLSASQHVSSSSTNVAAAAASTATKSGDVFWKIVVGLVLVFSLSTNVAVLYHIFVKKWPCELWTCVNFSSPFLDKRYFLFGYVLTSPIRLFCAFRRRNATLTVF